MISVAQWNSQWKTTRRRDCHSFKTLPPPFCLIPPPPPHPFFPQRLFPSYFHVSEPLIKGSLKPTTFSWILKWCPKDWFQCIGIFPPAGEWSHEAGWQHQRHDFQHPSADCLHQPVLHPWTRGRHSHWDTQRSGAHRGRGHNPVWSRWPCFHAIYCVEVTVGYV